MATQAQVKVELDPEAFVAGMKRMEDKLDALGGKMGQNKAKHTEFSNSAVKEIGGMIAGYASVGAAIAAIQMVYAKWQESQSKITQQVVSDAQKIMGLVASTSAAGTPQQIAARNQIAMAANPAIKAEEATAAQSMFVKEGAKPADMPGLMSSWAKMAAAGGGVANVDMAARTFAEFQGSPEFAGMDKRAVANKLGYMQGMTKGKGSLSDSAAQMEQARTAGLDIYDSAALVTAGMESDQNSKAVSSLLQGLVKDMPVSDVKGGSPLMQKTIDYAMLTGNFSAIPDATLRDKARKASKLKKANALKGKDRLTAMQADPEMAKEVLGEDALKSLTILSGIQDKGREAREYAGDYWGDLEKQRAGYAPAEAAYAGEGLKTGTAEATKKRAGTDAQGRQIIKQAMFADLEQRGYGEVFRDMVTPFVSLAAYDTYATKKRLDPNYNAAADPAVLKTLGKFNEAQKVTSSMATLAQEKNHPLDMGLAQ